MNSLVTEASRNDAASTSPRLDDGPRGVDDGRCDVIGAGQRVDGSSARRAVRTSVDGVDTCGDASDVEEAPHRDRGAGNADDDPDDDDEDLGHQQLVEPEAPMTPAP